MYTHRKEESVIQVYDCANNYDTRTGTLNGKEVVKADNVFSHTNLINSNAEIDRLDSFKYTNAGNVIRSVKFQDLGYGIMPPICHADFDSEGTLTNLSGINESFLKGTDSIKELSKNSVQRLSCVQGWRDVTVSVEFNILIYTLDYSQQRITNMPWHIDDNPTSFTVLISDYTNENGSYSGGELSFACSETPADVKPKPIMKTEVKLQYKKNCGFIFNNSILHRVNDIKLESLQKQSVQRRLFTCFADFPQPKELYSFSNDD